MSKALLITSATGKQGTATITALLKADADFEILALTRNAQSASAQKLQAKSSKIKLITGHLDDVDDVFRKVKQATELPIWGVFRVQVAIGGGATPQTEEKQGKALIDAAIKHGIKHFVYSSVDRGGSKSDTNATTVPHFASKYRVEQYLFEKTRNGEMDWVILRPVAFYENLVPGFLGKVFATSWYSILKDKPLQLVATSDIGFFAAEAFTKPEEYKSQKLSLAGEELTYTQFKTIFAETTGQSLPTTFRFVAGAINMMVKDLGLMFKWFNDVGYGADISKVRQINPALKGFETWLKEDSQFKTR
ncbi:uncharacterized protein EKO05_0003216 [Ascochyta rabiei]|uniref:NmrA-like domain-containing protein n=1 Tax=Didymella rabiei TaxID=5454 RepID=A0A163GVH4_DIDRA|nr:uncharacterized protein EKO05_0003216 [Ascochyta rabiei]KZM25035.1 hypothetical protein ST47_g3823 [Ascochyta rabiei]UPX12676.1 hypothetical protein EKO05_0003216 [Ascochyta rabiei]